MHIEMDLSTSTTLLRQSRMLYSYEGGGGVGSAWCLICEVAFAPGTRR